VILCFIKNLTSSMCFGFPRRPLQNCANSNYTNAGLFPYFLSYRYSNYCLSIYQKSSTVLEGQRGYFLRLNPTKKTWCIGHNAGVDYNLTLLSTPESTPTHLPWTTLRQSRLNTPVMDFGFGLTAQFAKKY
jgi:hypothetical protein